MTESSQILIDARSFVALMLKEQGIHEGLWTFTVEFQLSIGVAGASVATAMPTAMASVMRLGIQKGSEINSITFDAAELNPAIKPARRKSKTPEVDK